jgi:transposase InsO family protein
VIFHTDQGGEYSSGQFGAACRSLGVTQSMGRVSSALDSAAAESFLSILEHELLSRRQFATPRRSPPGRRRLDRPLLQPDQVTLHPRNAIPDRLLPVPMSLLERRGHLIGRDLQGGEQS